VILVFVYPHTDGYEGAMQASARKAITLAKLTSWPSGWITQRATPPSLFGKAIKPNRIVRS